MTSFVDTQNGFEMQPLSGADGPLGFAWLAALAPLIQGASGKESQQSFDAFAAAQVQEQAEKVRQKTMIWGLVIAGVAILGVGLYYGAK